MSREVRPDNPNPVLFCEGILPCKDQPVRHEFVRAEPLGNGAFKLKFASDCCGHERVFGVVDPGAGGR